MIPAFAAYYSFVLPNDFYHNNLRLEPEFRFLEEDISSSIRSSILHSIKILNGHSKYNLDPKNTEENAGSSIRKFFNDRYDLGQKEKIKLAENDILGKHHYSSYIKDGRLILNGSNRGPFDYKTKASINLHEIKIGNLNIDEGNFIFTVQIPPLIVFSIEKPSKNIMEELNKSFPNMDLTQHAEIQASLQDIALKATKGISSLVIPPHICSYPFYMKKVRSLNHYFKCKIHSSHPTTSGFRGLEYLWTVQVQNRTFPIYEDNDIRSELLPIFNIEEFSKKWDTFDKIIKGKANEMENHYARMLYLSAVTITTLGYGDITPITFHARLAITVQSILGVILIGLFLYSLTRPNA